MKSQSSAQRRRPPSKRQVTPEVYELLKRTHRVLKSNGVRVKADLWNPRGDGRTWIFIFEPADKMPQSADPIDLVRSALEAEGVEVLSVQKRENGTFGVAVCPSARDSSAAESPRSSQDSISGLLREFDGLDPSFLTTPIPSNQTIADEWRKAHNGQDPTMEWLPPAVAPEISELLRGVHQILTRNGFDVGAHPWNRHGDGRTWSVIFEPTEEMPKGADPVELARRVLEEKGVEVKSAHKLKNGSFGVVILPPARASRSSAASLGPEQDPASELFQKSEGIDPAVFTPSANEWPKANNLDTLEEKLREDFKRAREMFRPASPDLTNLDSDRRSHAHADDSARPANGNAREAFVRPLLTQKGWSVPDWATESNVDFHTADNYLKGKTNPVPFTRKKLADSLGVRAQELPA